MVFKPVIVPMFWRSITGAVFINRNNINLATVPIFSANKCDIASNGVVFYASLAPDEIITALNNLTSSTSNVALPHGSDIYTGVGYFEETFPNATGAISGTYENNEMLIQLYYDNITFKIAVKGSNGLSYGIPVSNTTVVYFIPHHINVTSEMTLLMFYIGVQYFLVYHHSLYRNVKEGNMKVKSTENTNISDSVAGGSFVPYIICCHPGDCACESTTYDYKASNGGQVCDEDDGSVIADMVINVNVPYTGASLCTGSLNVTTCVDGCADFFGYDGFLVPYYFDYGTFNVEDTKGFSFTSSFPSYTTLQSKCFSNQDTTICGILSISYVSDCGEVVVNAPTGDITINVPQLTTT